MPIKASIIVGPAARRMLRNNANPARGCAKLRVHPVQMRRRGTITRGSWAQRYTTLFQFFGSFQSSSSSSRVMPYHHLSLWCHNVSILQTLAQNAQFERCRRGNCKNGGRYWDRTTSPLRFSRWTSPIPMGTAPYLVQFAALFRTLPARGQLCHLLCQF